MAGLRRLFDHPTVLADGAPASPSLARTRALALPRAGPRLDRHVGRHRRADRPVAQRRALFDAVDLDSRSACCFATGIFIYSRSGAHFSWAQLGGLPEVRTGNHDQRLVTTGIRSRVRHPVYLGHLCEMLAWSVGTGLVVCWVLTAFAIATGAVMIRMEDAELEKRFGEEFAELSPECRRGVAAGFAHEPSIRSNPIALVIIRLG